MRKMCPNNMERGQGSDVRRTSSKIINDCDEGLRGRKKGV